MTLIKTSVTEPRHDRALAYLLLRITMGTNICIHGVSRLIRGPASFAHSLLPLFHKTFLPGWSVLAFGWMLPWLESSLGLLLPPGLRTRLALVAGQGCLLL